MSGGLKGVIKQFPHCDPRILHTKGECEFCDAHPEWQELREHWGIAFTGHKPTKDDLREELPCPADFNRGEAHKIWPGNRPVPQHVAPLHDGITDKREDVDTTPGPSGMQRSYLVLSEEERARGFVRPVRRSYKHVGLSGPQYPTRDLTAEEHERYDSYGYAVFEPYPVGGAATGRFWTQEQLDAVGKGCGTTTTMGQAIAESYARQPGFYGSTMCVHCGVHLPVGEDGEFVWDGTTERVGT